MFNTVPLEPWNVDIIYGNNTILQYTLPETSDMNNDSISITFKQGFDADFMTFSESDRTLSILQDKVPKQDVK